MSAPVNSAEIVVVTKNTEMASTVVPSGYTLEEASVVQLNVPRAAIKAMGREGNDLTVTLHDGQQLLVRDYFLAQGADVNHLVLMDELEGMWQVEFTESGGRLAFTYSNIPSIDPLLVAQGGAEAVGGGAMPYVMAMGAGAMGLAAIASSRKTSDRAALEDNAPSDPVLHPINGTAPITGVAQPGSLVMVTYPDGKSVMQVVGSDGKFKLDNPGFNHNDEIKVVITGPDGTLSAQFTAQADTEAPATATLHPVNAKDPITGTAEPGSTVTVVFPNGGSTTAKVGDDGSFSVPNPGLKNDDRVIVKVTDEAGNTSASVAQALVDARPPAPAAVDPISSHGPVTGQAEPGSVVTVTFPDGTIATGLAGDDGVFSVPHPEGVPPLASGETVSITVTDAAGNSSSAVQPEPALEPLPEPQGESPALSITDDVAGVMGKGAAVTFTLTFSKEVQGFNADDIAITGGVKGAFTQTGPTTYTLVVTPRDGVIGEIVLDVAAGAATDVAGLPTQAASASQPFDTRVPNALTLSNLQLHDDVGAVQGAIQHGTKTDDVRPTFSGKADVSQVARVEILDNGTLIGSVDVDAQGHWSFEPSLPLVPGEHNLQARPVNAAGNTGVPTSVLSFEVLGALPLSPAITGVEDNAGSVQGNIQPGTTTDDRTPTLQGTAQAGTIVKIYDGEKLVGSAVAEANGTWSVTTNQLGEGVHRLTATATDPAGQVSHPTGEYVITVDTTAPTKPATVHAQDNQGDVRGPIAMDGTTDDAKPVFSGVGAAGEKATILDNGKAIGTAVVGEDGTWSFTPATALGEGAHGISVTLTDKAGNTSEASDVLNFQVDSSALELRIIEVLDDAGSLTGAVASGDATDDRTPTFIGKASVGATVGIYEGNTLVASGTANAQGEWRITLPAQSEGTHLYTARAVSAAGNLLSTDFSLAIDITPSSVPTLSSIHDDVGSKRGELAHGASTDDTTPSLKGTGTPGDAIRVYDNGNYIGSTEVGANGEWAYTVNPPLIVQGPHVFTATSVDAVGNESAHSAGFEITLDVVAPNVSGMELKIDDIMGDNAITAAQAQGPVLVSGSLSGIPADADKTSITVMINGVAHAATLDGLAWSLSVPGAELIDNPSPVISVKVMVEDAAGNAVQAFDMAKGYQVTKNVPVIHIDSGIGGDGVINQTEMTSVVVSGTTSNVDDGCVVTVTFTDGGQNIAVHATVMNGKWTASAANLGSLQQGNIAITAQVTDQENNSTSATASVMLDSVGPVEAKYAVAITSYLDNAAPVTGLQASGTSTNDNSPELHGTIAGLESGDVVRIYEGSNLLGLATITEAGKWTYQLNAVTQGEHSYQAVIVDAAGNEGKNSGSFTLTVDTNAPAAIPSIAGYQDNVGKLQDTYGSGTVTDDLAPTLMGTLSAALKAGEAVRIYQGGTLLGTATVNGMQWSFDVAGLQTGQSYTYTAATVSAAGVETALSAPLTLTVNTTPPSATTSMSYYDGAGEAQGEFGTDTVTDDRAPEIRGELNEPLAAGEQVMLYEGARFLGSAQVDGTSWTFTLPEVLENGASYTFTAVLTSAAGIEGASTSLSLDVELAGIVQAQTTTDTTPIISGGLGFAFEPGEYVEVRVNGVIYSSKDGAVVMDRANGTWYLQIPDDQALAVGSYEVDAVLFKENGEVVAGDKSTNELVITNAPKITFRSSSATADDINTALTINEDGAWRVLSNSTVFTQSGSDTATLGAFSSHELKGTPIALGGNEKQQQSTFIDYNRDGLMDILGEDHVYGNGQQAFRYDGTTYKAYQIGANGVSGQAADPNGLARVKQGGVIGIDFNGDGLVDVVYGNDETFRLGLPSGYDTQLLENTNGTISGFDKMGQYVDWPDSQDGGPTPTNFHNGQPNRELSGVDIDNDGFVDLAYHGGEGVNTIDKGSSEISDQRLVIVKNGVDEDGQTTLANTEIVKGVFYDSTSEVNRTTSMTWADFNGDGYMDLFLGGRTSAILRSQSSIYYNDGTGRLTAASGGVGAGAKVQWLDDNVEGQVSLAVDWNGDGRMDAIEIAGEYTSTFSFDNIGKLWLNEGVNQATQMVQWKSETILSTANLSSSQYVSGAVALDLDFDGDQDLAVFRMEGGQTTYIENKNQIQDGTSIILRVLDAQGLNRFYGNTVLLVDEATGQVVSSQIINAQSGNGTNNSTGLVYFYGLDADKSYSAVLLANGNDYGGVDSVAMHSVNDIENYNATWGGLKAVAANHAYVLTAENGEKAADAAQAATDGTNLTGIVGTGYNDTLFATAGTHTYNGGGGAVEVSGVRQWSAQGGMDIVDYVSAGATAVTIDLNDTGMQDTGFGHARLINIEGVAGAGGDDVFIGNSGDNFFEGRGGNDSFHLGNGGRDTLIYKLLNAADGTGGNGSDQAHGFTVGIWEATANADRIDLSQLLQGYTPSIDGQYAAQFVNGVATIDAGDAIHQYLKVDVSGGDTAVKVDIHGTGQNYTTLVTLQGVQTDLATLLANHQISLV